MSVPEYTESERLAALHALQILDSSPEALFDALVRAAAEVAERPISLISLIDESRQWFKANVGLTDVAEMPREYAFCEHVVQSRQIVEVPDAQLDARFAGNPLVTGMPRIRAYTGVPILLENGMALGALCVVDRAPGRMSPMQLRVLDQLGRAAALAIIQRAELIGQRQAAQNETAEANRLTALSHGLEKELRASEQFLSRTGRIAGVGGWEVDLLAKTVRWSDQTCLIHDLPKGYRPDLAEALNFYTPEARPLITAAIDQALAEQQPWDLELPMLTAAGRSIWVRAAGAVEMEDDVPVKLSGAVQDISDRRRAVAALEASERRFRKLFQYSLGLICTHDLDGTLLSVNPAAAASIGYDVAEILGRSLGDFMRPDHAQHLTVYLARIAEQRMDTGTMELVARDGSLRYWRYQNVLDTDGDESYVVGHAQDVTEQRSHEKTLIEWSTMDPLTHAMNRRYLSNLEQSLTPDARWGCVAIDIDHFKQVNDTQGHQRGDELLVAVADMLRSACGPRDTVVRMGGDEFIVVVDDPCRLDDVAGQVDTLQHRIGVSLSIGTATREPGEPVDAVISRADQKLYSTRATVRQRARPG